MLTPDLRRCRLLSLLLRKGHAEGYTEYAKVYSVYLLYWYKSANNDARGHAEGCTEYANVYSVYLLYWYKSAKTDARVCEGHVGGVGGR